MPFPGHPGQLFLWWRHATQRKRALQNQRQLRFRVPVSPGHKRPPWAAILLQGQKQLQSRGLVNRAGEPSMAQARLASMAQAWLAAARSAPMDRHRKAATSMSQAAAALAATATKTAGTPALGARLRSLVEPCPVGLALAAARLEAAAGAHAMLSWMVPPMHPCLWPMLRAIRPQDRKTSGARPIPQNATAFSQRSAMRMGSGKASGYHVRRSAAVGPVACAFQDTTNASSSSRRPATRPVSGRTWVRSARWFATAAPAPPARRRPRNATALNPRPATPTVCGKTRGARALGATHARRQPESVRPCLTERAAALTRAAPSLAKRVHVPRGQQ